MNRGKSIKKKSSRKGTRQLTKSPTGVSGLDQILSGGLPYGRTTLICGEAGCGKTVLALEFVLQGADRYGEPGVFVTFEETPEEVQQDAIRPDGSVAALVKKKKLVFDYVYVGRGEIEEAGEYGLDGLLIRLGSAIDSIGAKRVVLDSIEALFGGIPNEAILRNELYRLFRWLKSKGVTSVVTAERGGGRLTRHGLEEYVSDCVILLDQRIRDQIATRHLRIVKYRGSAHGTNEYPFLIDADGVSVTPVTSIELKHDVPKSSVSSGVTDLDRMLTGGGYFRGSTVLVSGVAGSGKTSLASTFIDAACRRGERALYLSLEESESQIIRNMQSISISLGRWVKKGLLQFYAQRPTTYGLEMHLARIYRWIDEFKPQVVVLDPITDFGSAGSYAEVSTTLMRVVDLMKSRQITAMFTSLLSNRTPEDMTEVGVSSLIDTWLVLRNMEISGERDRVLYILKSRGMAHSNQVREFILTNHGVELKDIYLGPKGVLTGSARIAQEADEAAEALIRRQGIERKKYSLERKREALESRIASLKSEFEAEAEQLQMELTQDDFRKKQELRNRNHLARSRGVGEVGE